MDSNDELARDDMDGDVDDAVEIQVNPMMHVIAPLAAIVVTMIVRKAVNSAYEKSTGHPPPLPRDPQVSLVRAIAWTALITTTAAVAEVAVYRLITQLGEKKA